MRFMRTSALYTAVLVGVLLASANLPAPGVHASARPASTGRSLDQTSVLTPARHWGAVFFAIRGRVLAARAGPAGTQAAASVSYLSGVFCTSAANCWAVGTHSTGKTIVNLVLHWNGKTWRNVAVPHPGGAGSGFVSLLYAVRCLAARDCWAVGEYAKGGAYLDEALHWNGRKWYSVATPAPAGSRSGDINELYDSTCTSSRSCWAVGDYGKSNGSSEKRLNQVLHWNGKRWSSVRISDPGGTNAGHVNTLSAVRCLSPANCLVDGDYVTSAATTYVALNEAMHWNGKRWSEVRTPNPGGTAAGSFSQLYALACGSPTSCWGAGSYGTNEPTITTLNQILHWNGRSWARVVTPSPDGTSAGATNELYGATCGTSHDCWAVGSYGNSAGAIVNEALHWNGKKWSLVSTPNPDGTATGDRNTLLAARCTSSTNCWAVGYLETMDTTTEQIQNEILHWNGRKWS